VDPERRDGKHPIVIVIPIVVLLALVACFVVKRLVIPSEAKAPPNGGTTTPSAGATSASIASGTTVVAASANEPKVLQALRELAAAELAFKERVSAEEVSGVKAGHRFGFLRELKQNGILESTTLSSWVPGNIAFDNWFITAVPSRTDPTARWWAFVKPMDALEKPGTRYRVFCTNQTGKIWTETRVAVQGFDSGVIPDGDTCDPPSTYVLYEDAR
jgi:hypothetical protein